MSKKIYLFLSLGLINHTMAVKVGFDINASTAKAASNLSAAETAIGRLSTETTISKPADHRLTHEEALFENLEGLKAKKHESDADKAAYLEAKKHYNDYWDMKMAIQKDRDEACAKQQRENLTAAAGAAQALTDGLKEMGALIEEVNKLTSR